ncbi:toll/interleukin-1 receptor domain-containing protein [Herbidospora galbida]|uniref:toll/interleukin-1 receptor domain-containing protein n=1 Tax=Herbidospora galbida TaxID=2575442 RepID=UPI0014850096|nr:toll/interleukin-1 receptor domain-containing protein [Herbidospora galbida]
MGEEKRDFFISYNQADLAWAEWIAWHLESADYTTIIQRWDFRAGANFVLKMQEATEKAKSVIMVLSPDYLTSDFTAPEWAAMFAADPRGLNREIIPVMVRPCDPKGMLAAIIQIRLMNLEESAALKELLAGVRPERQKPTSAPPFPGPPSSDPSPGVPAFPGRAASAPLPWLPHRQYVAVGERATAIVGDVRGVRLEAHLIPVSTENAIATSPSANLPDRLIEIGCETSLFTKRRGLKSGLSLGAAWALADDVSAEGQRGLTFTATGHRFAWTSIPAEKPEYVFDPADVRTRLRLLFDTLVKIALPPTKLVPTAVLYSTVGGVPRSTAGGSTPFTTGLDSYLESSLVISRTADIAEELTDELQELVRNHSR